jgi:dolichol-phosphate mannosyltransferase
MDKKRNLSIIIPTYNEKENVVLLISSLKEILKTWDFEIVIVDDNSPDGTHKEIIRKFGTDKRIKAILQKNKKGLASAILHGIKASKNEIILGMDGDFNHPPAIIPQMINELQANDFVVASRFIKGGGMEDKKRYIATYIFNKFLKHALGFPTKDNKSGFYVIKRRHLLNFPLDKVYKGYGEYHLRLVFLAKKNGLKIKEVPVFYNKRAYGDSKSNLPKMFFLYLKEAFKLRLFYGQRL